MGRRVLITGVSGYWGAALARRLERLPEIEYVAGLDVRPPAGDLPRTEFIRADIARWSALARERNISLD